MTSFAGQQRGVAVRMVAGLAITLIVVGVAILVYQGTPAQSFADRIRLVLRWDAFIVAWLAAAIANVARLRFFSVRDIAGSRIGDASDDVRDASAILQNTLEQVVLAMAVQLIAAATLGRCDRLIGATVVLFGVGRLLFWWGYRRGPSHRALGFALTFYPSLAVLAICLGMIVAG